MPIYIDRKNVTEEQLAAAAKIFAEGRQCGASTRLGRGGAYSGNPYANESAVLRELWFDGYFEGLSVPGPPTDEELAILEAFRNEPESPYWKARKGQKYRFPKSVLRYLNEYSEWRNKIASVLCRIADKGRQP